MLTADGSTGSRFSSPVVSEKATRYLVRGLERNQYISPQLRQDVVSNLSLFGDRFFREPAKLLLHLPVNSGILFRCIQTVIDRSIPIGVFGDGYGA